MIDKKEYRNKFIDDIINFLNEHRDDFTLKAEIESTKIEEMGHCLDGTVYGKNNTIITIKSTNFYKKDDELAYRWRKVGE